MVKLRNLLTSQGLPLSENSEMGGQKTVSIFWSTVLIASAICSHSTAFSSRSVANYPPKDSSSPAAPSTPASLSPWSQVYPPEASPPPSSPFVSAPSPFSSPIPQAPSLPYPWSPYLSPLPASTPPYPATEPYPMPPSPSPSSDTPPPMPTYMPPYPATVPYPMPPSPSPSPSSGTPPPMPTSMPPYPATVPYPMPPSPSPSPSSGTPPPMPTSMPPYPATMPYPMPPSPSPLPTYMPPYPATEPYPMPPSPSPMPTYIPPYPATVPYPMPPTPSPLPSSMPPYPSSGTPSPIPSSMPPYPATVPYPMPPSPSPIPSSMPPSPSAVPPPASQSPPAENPMLPPPPATPSPVPPSPPMPSSNGIKGGYWPSWLADEFPPSTIPTRYLTHLFYAFVSIDPSSYQLSITQNDDHWMTDFVLTLHSQYPPSKTFLSIGGSDSNASTIFSNMASNPANRATFIKSTIQVAKKYGFDGLDLAWLYPNTKEDMSNLAMLFKEWRQYIENDSKQYGTPQLLLSAAVYFSPDFFLSGVPRSYPGGAIRSYVDFIKPLNFDYYGSWDTSVTAEHAVLFDNSSRVCTAYGMDAWPMAGVYPWQLVLGLPLYGRTWKLKDPEEHGIGALAVGVGPGKDGFMTYKEIVEYNLGNGATEVFNNVSVSTYSYKGTDWIGYDGKESIRRKIEYAKSLGLGGYYFWAIGYDRNWELSQLASLVWDS